MMYLKEISRSSIYLPAIPGRRFRRLNGDTIPFRLSSETYEQLKQMLEKTGTTFYMLLLAIYTILLHKYSGQEDIVIGTIFAGRNHVELEGLVGYLAKTLALRQFPTARKSFPVFLEEVKTNVINAFDNQLYPFNRLVEKLEIPTKPGRNPVYDAAFVFQNTNMTSSETSFAESARGHRQSN